MVSSLLAAASRQYRTANQRYSQYMVERLGMCIMSVAQIRDTIRNTTERMSTRDPQLSDYQSSLEELLTCLRQLSIQWVKNTLFEKIEKPVIGSSYTSV